MVSTLDILKRLNSNQVAYVLVGGIACVIHGSQAVTQDVDICAPFTSENLSKLQIALKDVHPRFRMARDFQPLPSNPETLESYKNLYLHTDLGQLDVLSEITGIGNYYEVERHIIIVDLGGLPVRVLNLDALILAKRAMNTPKDLQVVMELSAIRERLRSIDKAKPG
jgi:hypothetical protein